MARLAGVKRYKFAPRAINQDLVGVKYRKFIRRAVRLGPNSADTAPIAREIARQTEQNDKPSRQAARQAVLKCKRVVIYPLNLTQAAALSCIKSL